MTQTRDRFPCTTRKQLHFRFASSSCVFWCSSPNSVFLSRASSPWVLHVTLPLWGRPLAFTISHVHLTPRWAQIVMAVFPENYLSKGPPDSFLFIIFAFGSCWMPLPQLQFMAKELSTATQTPCKLFIHVFNRLSCSQWAFQPSALCIYAPELIDYRVLATPSAYPLLSFESNFYSLRILSMHAMHFDHIYLPLLPDPPHPPNPSQLSAPHPFIAHWFQFVLSIYLWVVEPSTGTWSTYQESHP